jgi:predicted nucleic acid-binding protein
VNIVDSSLWLEYFAGNTVGTQVSAIIKDVDSLYVPTITIYEVFKKLLYEKTETDALIATAHMMQGTIIDLNIELSLLAAKISKNYQIPMADSIVYATNQKYNCTLWTQDKHFAGLESVQYFEKLS